MTTRHIETQERPHIENWPVRPTQVPQWRRRLAEAEERGEWTRADWDAMASYTTCAIGERHGFPRNYHYSKTERERDIGGWEIINAMQRLDFAEFRKLLDEIDAMPEVRND